MFGLHVRMYVRSSLALKLEVVMRFSYRSLVGAEPNPCLLEEQQAEPSLQLCRPERDISVDAFTLVPYIPINSV